MAFWHLGASLWLFRWVFRDPGADVRFLLAGAILPDLIDMPVGALSSADGHLAGELWTHSLTLPAAFMAVVLLATGRGRRRRAWLALGVGWLLHLLLDAMWVEERVFLWPLFGLEIGEAAQALPRRPGFGDPWLWVGEAVGLGYLVWLWFAAGLNHRERRRAVIATGRIPDHAAEGARRGPRAGGGRLRG